MFSLRYVVFPSLVSILRSKSISNIKDTQCGIKERNLDEMQERLIKESHCFFVECLESDFWGLHKTHVSVNRKPTDLSEMDFDLKQKLEKRTHALFPVTSSVIIRSVNKWKEKTYHSNFQKAGCCSQDIGP